MFWVVVVLGGTCAWVGWVVVGLSGLEFWVCGGVGGWWLLLCF